MEKNIATLWQRVTTEPYIARGPTRTWPVFLNGFYDVLFLKNVKHLNIDFQLFLLFNLDKKDGYCENSSAF